MNPVAACKIYTEDATFVMPGIPLIQGRAEMLRQLENGTLLRSVALTPSTIEAREDLAYADGLFSCIQNETPVTLRFLMVLRSRRTVRGASRASSWLQILRPLEPTPGNSA